MLPITENGIFWNTYEQECRFKGEIMQPPSSVRTTCNKLAAFYPDLDDAEMFMRAQFLLGTPSSGVCLSTIVLHFKDFIRDEHHQNYADYKEIAEEEACQRLDRAYDIRRSYLDSRCYPWQSNIDPLGIYLARMEDSPQSIQDRVVIECLHWSLLVGKLPLTDYVKRKIRYYKNEVHVNEEKYKPNSRYLVDLS